MVERRWLTPAELGRRLALSERTVQRHLRRHAAYLEVRRERRGSLVSPDSLHVLERIRDLYASGRTAEQVDDALRADRLPVTLDATPAHPEPLPAREALTLLVSALEQERTARALAERQAAEDRAALLAALLELRREVAELRAERHAEPAAPAPPLEPGLSLEGRSLLEKLRRAARGGDAGAPAEEVG